jgi:hypothetical protein
VGGAAAFAGNAALLGWVHGGEAAHALARGSGGFGGGRTLGSGSSGWGGLAIGVHSAERMKDWKGKRPAAFNGRFPKLDGLNPAKNAFTGQNTDFYRRALRS